MILNNSSRWHSNFASILVNQTNGLEYITVAAKILKNDNYQNINFILIEKGGVKPRLLKLSQDMNLRNVQFIDAQPMDLVSEIVNLCDVSIVPFKNIPILQTNSPNKLFDSLSAGIPIIVNSAGWTKNLVEENKCGTYVTPVKLLSLHQF